MLSPELARKLSKRGVNFSIEQQYYYTIDEEEYVVGPKCKCCGRGEIIDIRERLHLGTHFIGRALSETYGGKEHPAHYIPTLAQLLEKIDKKGFGRQHTFTCNGEEWGYKTERMVREIPLVVSGQGKTKEDAVADALLKIVLGEE